MGQKGREEQWVRQGWGPNVDTEIHVHPSDELRTVVSEILDIDPDAFLNVIKTEQLSGKFHLHPND